MNIPFLGNKSKKHRAAVLAGDPEGIAELLSECEVLRSHAAREGIGLDDSVASLEALDQMPPRWRDDEENLPWFGHDAGLYLGTVVVRTVPGAAWVIRPGGEAVVRLTSGREVDVVAAGFEWAATGTPELSQLYAEVAEH
ncbi:DUF6278 family protein [Streptomyces sp. NPDC058291]|jgi:hypothetical protein|uniref:DUF6278 family protein n=1 Tax=Streptomyces sp. NPDC058291 TaxID=3346427 RepID=UPI0036E26BCF